MLRNKLSFILASSLSLSFVACDDGDDGGDTGAGATESSGTESDTTDTPTTDTPTTDTPTTDTPTTDDPTTDDSSTTDDTSDDSSTTDDTSADPCADVVCEDGESCVGGICVEDGGETDGATDTGGDGDANYPNPDGGCPDGTVDGNTAVNPGVNICIPACDPDAADTQMACVQPETGTGIGACVLAQPPAKDAMACGDGTEIMAGAACPGAGEYCLSAADGSSTCVVAVGCLVLCGPNGELTCPDGMTCGGGVCSY